VFITDTPSEPRNLQVKECSKDYIDIAWSPPETDGGSEIQQYVIERRDVTRGIGTWMVSGTVSAAEFTFRAGKLFQGNAYQFRVSAENRVGAGPPVEMQEAAVADLPFGEFLPDFQGHFDYCSERYHWVGNYGLLGVQCTSKPFYFASVSLFLFSLYKLHESQTSGSIGLCTQFIILVSHLSICMSGSSCDKRCVKIRFLFKGGCLFSELVKSNSLHIWYNICQIESVLILL